MPHLVDIGITRYLIRDLDLRITCPLNTLGFTLYTTFKRKTSTGTMHQLAFWICSPQSPSRTSQSSKSTTRPGAAYPHSMLEEDNEKNGTVNGICQRIWWTDALLITSPVLPLPLPSSSDQGHGGGLAPPGAKEGMILASKHVKSPMKIAFGGQPADGDRGRPDDDGAQADPFKDSGGEGRESPTGVRAYAPSGYSISGHSGAFGTEGEAEYDDGEEELGLLRKEKD